MMVRYGILRVATTAHVQHYSSLRLVTLGCVSLWRNSTTTTSQQQQHQLGVDDTIQADLRRRDREAVRLRFASP